MVRTPVTVVRGTTVMEGVPFFDLSLPSALRKAQQHAGVDGFVASVPELIRGRNSIPHPTYEGEWDNWYSALSEEDVGRTTQGNPIVIIAHGGGILSSPERIEQAYAQGLIIDQSKAKLSEKEIRDLLGGKLPTGGQISVYSFNEFKTGINDLPMIYAVVMDLSLAKKSKSDVQDSNSLRDDALFIVRCGGVAEAGKYLDTANRIYSYYTLGNYHEFHRVDPAQPQGWLLFLSSHTAGFGGGLITGSGHFVAVAPGKQRAVQPKLTLEQRM